MNASEWIDRVRKAKGLPSYYAAAWSLVDPLSLDSRLAYTVRRKPSQRTNAGRP